MPELTVVAVLTAKADAIETIQAGLSKLTAAARTEDGCISYDLHVDASNPARFVTVERWASQEALDAHFVSPAMAEAMTSLTELDGAPLIVTTTKLDV
jgi:quinol monooxygenase YgiN